MAELEVTNVMLNTALGVAIAGRITVKEELNYCKSDSYKKHVIDDYKSSSKYNAELGRDACSFLNKSCVNIICQLHPYFEDKFVLLRAFEANFDNESCKQGLDFVPFTAEEMDALWERDEQRGRSICNPPPPSNPTFWDVLDGSSASLS